MIEKRIYKSQIIQIEILKQNLLEIVAFLF